MANINIEELSRMRDTDISCINENTLVDVTKVKIKKDLPIPERVADFISQVKNPYCFKVGSVVVKLNFTEGGTSCQEAFYSMANAIR